MTTQFLYKKVSCNTTGRYVKRINWINTDNVPVPEREAQRYLVNLLRIWSDLESEFCLMLSSIPDESLSRYVTESHNLTKVFTITEKLVCL